MRSLVGLVAVVVSASLYLYSLSLYLPAGPRRRPHSATDKEHVDSESEKLQPPDSAEETSRWLMLAVSRRGLTLPAAFKVVFKLYATVTSLLVSS